MRYTAPLRLTSRCTRRRRPGPYDAVPLPITAPAARVCREFVCAQLGAYECLLCLHSVPRAMQCSSCKTPIACMPCFDKLVVSSLTDLSEGRTIWKDAQVYARRRHKRFGPWIANTFFPDLVSRATSRPSSRLSAPTGAEGLQQAVDASLVAGKSVLRCPHCRADFCGQSIGDDPRQVWKALHQDPELVDTCLDSTTLAQVLHDRGHHTASNLQASLGPFKSAKTGRRYHADHAFFKGSAHGTRIPCLLAGCRGRIRVPISDWNYTQPETIRAAIVEHWRMHFMTDCQATPAATEITQTVAWYTQQLRSLGNGSNPAMARLLLYPAVPVRIEPSTQRALHTTIPAELFMRMQDMDWFTTAISVQT